MVSLKKCLLKSNFLVATMIKQLQRMRLCLFVCYLREAYTQPCMLKTEMYNYITLFCFFF